MSEISIGGFPKADSRYSFPKCQDISTGIVIPQVLFIGENATKAAVVQEFNRSSSEDKTSITAISENIFGTNVIEPSRARVDIGESNRLVEDNRILDLTQAFKDITNFFNSQAPRILNYDFPSDVEITKIDVGNIFAGNLNEYLDSTKPFFIRQLDMPVLKYNIYSFYKDGASAFVLIFDNVKVKFSQKFKAFQPFGSSRRDAIIQDLVTDLIIDTPGDAGRFSIIYNDTSGGRVETKVDSGNFLGLQSNDPQALRFIKTKEIATNNDLNTILNKFKEPRFLSITKNKKITNSLVDAEFNGETINKTYILPDDEFLRNYINIIFYSAINTLSRDIGNMHEYYGIIYAFLVSTIFTKIREPETFSFGNYKVKILEASNNIRYDNIGLKSFEELQLFRRKLYKYSSPTIEIDYSPGREFNQSNAVIADLYRKIIDRPYIVEALEIIYECATYIGEFDSEFRIEKQEDGRFKFELYKVINSF